MQNKFLQASRISHFNCLSLKYTTIIALFCLSLSIAGEAKSFQANKDGLGPYCSTGDWDAIRKCDNWCYKIYHRKMRIVPSPGTNQICYGSGGNTGQAYMCTCFD